MALYIGSDMVVTISNLYDTVSETFLDDATVAGVLLTSLGATVTTFTLTYITGSNGDYRGTITHTVTAGLTLNADYTVRVTSTSMGGIVLVDSDVHTALAL